MTEEQKKAAIKEAMEKRAGKNEKHRSAPDMSAAMSEAKARSKNKKKWFLLVNNEKMNESSQWFVICKNNTWSCETMHENVKSAVHFVQWHREFYRIRAGTTISWQLRGRLCICSIIDFYSNVSVCEYLRLCII